MPKVTEKTIPKVTIRIVPGKAGEYQKKVFRALFTRLIATVQNELKAENEAKGEH